MVKITNEKEMTIYFSVKFPNMLFCRLTYEKNIFIAITSSSCI